MRTSTSRSPEPASSHHRGAAAFTLCDLVAVLATIVVLAFLILPGIARANENGQGATCLENLRRLGQAWLLYAADYQTYLPPNSDSITGAPNSAWVRGITGIGGPEEFNPDNLKVSNYSMLANYLGGETTVFHCPADQRTGLYRGIDPNLKGTVVPSSRSYSMNGAVGTNPSLARGKAPVDGAWLDGSHGHLANSTWYTFGKLTDMIAPGPANTFVLLDEAPGSLNEGTFSFVGPSASHQKFLMIDWPATYHEGAANLFFGDGHAETHLWEDTRTKLTGVPSGLGNHPNNPDITWLATRATAQIGAPELTQARQDTQGRFQATSSTRRNTQYVLERSDSPAGGIWREVSSQRSTYGGAMVFTDGTAPADQAFYRVRTP